MVNNNNDMLDYNVLNGVIVKNLNFINDIVDKKGVVIFEEYCD